MEICYSVVLIQFLSLWMYSLQFNCCCYSGRWQNKGRRGVVGGGRCAFKTKGL